MILEYHIPRLGKLTVQLYPLAKKTYELLSHANHIDRMKRNPQLGIIRNVYEGAHHTRWEYVMTMLYIIDYLNKSKSGVGLSSNLKILKEDISGADVLQTWVLLLNSGHLKGTFATERALLSRLKDDALLRKTFRGGLPNNLEIRGLLQEIMDKEDVYRVHELISFFFIERLRRKSPCDVNLLVAVLKLFKFDPEKQKEKRRKLKFIFRNIRKIAFLFLDSNYGPVPIVFELGKILFNFDDHSKSLFSIEESQLLKNLESFEDLMSEIFYLSPKCIYSFGKQSRMIEKKISELHESKRKSIPELYKFLKSGHELDIKYWPIQSDQLLRLWFEEKKSPIPILGQIKPIETEKQINNILAESFCESTVLHEPSKRMMGITFSVKENLETKSLSRILSQIMQRLVFLQDLYKEKMKIKIRDPYRKVFQQACKEAILFILNKLWGKNLQFLPIQSAIYSDHWVIDRGSTKAANWLEDMQKWYSDRGVEADRLHELKTLSQTLKEISHRGTVLFTTGQILVRRKQDKTDLTDLDGVAICSHSNGLSLVLVEAKNKRVKSSSQAKTKIIQILNTMDINEVNEEDVKTIRGYGAYIQISLYSRVTREAKGT